MRHRGDAAMRRYEALCRVIDLALALQSPGRGMSLGDIEQRYGVCHTTALRMRDAVRQIFPELRHEPGGDGKRYWKLRRGRANGLVSWSADEIAALEAAIHWARETGLARRERALRSVADKVKALVQPIRLDDAEVPEATGGSPLRKEPAGNAGGPSRPPGLEPRLTPGVATPARPAGWEPIHTLPCRPPWYI